MPHRISISRADLRLLCLDATRALNEWEHNEAHSSNTLVALTKCDLTAGPLVLNRPTIVTSSRTGAGLNELRTAIHNTLRQQPGECGFVAGTAARVKDSVRLASEAIARSRQLVANGAGEELVAAELRLALVELGKIVGALYTDDILDRIFSRFCIGK